MTLDSEPRLALNLVIRYEFVRATGLLSGKYKVSTLAYQHTLARDEGLEVLGYHWHPGGNSHEDRPHVHIGSSQIHRDSTLSNKGHIMTGRCSLEQVVRTAIELGTRPLCDDWSEKLDVGHDLHVKHRSWH